MCIVNVYMPAPWLPGYACLAAPCTRLQTGCLPMHTRSLRRFPPILWPVADSCAGMPSLSKPGWWILYAWHLGHLPLARISGWDSSHGIVKVKILVLSEHVRPYGVYLLRSRLATFCPPALCMCCRRGPSNNILHHSSAMIARHSS